MLRSLPIVLLISSPLFAGDFTEKFARDSKTVTIAAEPAIHFENSRGEITIQGWDRPDVEITVFRAAMQRAVPLDRIQVAIDKDADGTAISTSVDKDRGRDVMVSYAVKAPRSTRIVVHSIHGGVYVDGIAGAIDASLRRGQITLRLQHAPAMQAHTAHGRVYSEFESQDKTRHWLNHDAIAAGSGQKLELHAEYGDIVVLKTVSAP